MNFDSVVGEILTVENKILPIVQLILKSTKTHTLFYTFCQKHSGFVFASGKNGSTLFIFMFVTFRRTLATAEWKPKWLY